MKPSLFFHGFSIQPQTEWWRFFRPFLLLMALPLAAFGQANYATPYTFATLAGQPGVTGTNNGTGSAARFNGPNGVAVDSAGNIYVADYYNGAIRKVTPAGVVTTLAALPSYSGPEGVAVDSATNLYVANWDNTIRKVTPVGTNWVVTTLAGRVGVEGTNDGTGTNALFSLPNGVAVDSTGNVYVADYGNSLIRKVTSAGMVTTLAGLSGSYSALGVAVDSTTNVYVAGSLRIQEVTPVGTNWVVTTLAGGRPGTNDGTGTNALFLAASGVTVDSATNVYVADQESDTIRKLTPMGTNWVVTTLAGLPQVRGTNDGTGSAAQFWFNAGVAVDGAGNLYVADTDNDTIRRGYLAGGAPVILTNGTGLTLSSILFGFNLTAAAGQPVVVDASTDLVTWSSIWTNTVGPGILPFGDPQSGAYSNRFYRAHLP